MKIQFTFLLMSICTSIIGQTSAFLKNIEYKVNYNIAIKNEDIFRLMDIVKYKTDVKT